MEHSTPKIEFYRQRTFSEKMNVVFDFIRENWKPLLKYSFYLIIPVCLVESYAVNSMSGSLSQLLETSGNDPDIFGQSMVALLSGTGLVRLCNLIGSAIMSGLIYALMQTYAVRENRLQNVTINDFKGILIGNIGKYALIFFAIIIMIIFIILIIGFFAAIISSISYVLIVPIIIVAIICLLPLLLVIPAYIFERDITFTSAIAKAWKLGVATLGGLVGLMIVLSIISYVIGSIATIPWAVTVFLGEMFSRTSEVAMTQAPGYKFLLYLFGLIQAFGSYIASIIGILGLAFQYFHAREKVEGVTVESNIDNFGKL